MKRPIAACFFAVLTFAAKAQKSYDASLIPKDLLAYASSVVRDEEVTIEVKDLDNAIYHVCGEFSC